MKNNKLFLKSALVLSLSTALVAPAVQAAQLTDLPVIVLTAPIVIPFGIAEAIQNKIDKQAAKKSQQEQRKRYEAQQISELQEITSFLQAGCQYKDLVSPQFKTVRSNLKYGLMNFVRDQESLLDYYSSDDSKMTVEVGGVTIEQRFGDVVHEPAQESRKRAVVKMKEMLFKYASSADDLNKRIYEANGLDGLPSEYKQLALNFACDQAQVDLSTWYFKEVLQTQAEASAQLNKK